MIVLDASVALAWCFEDERTPEIEKVLFDVSINGAVVPQLWPIEVSNILALTSRKGRLAPHLRDPIIESLRNLAIEIDAETTVRAWNDIMPLAEKHGLTTYDASYLELAVRLQLPLATQDEALAAAARAENLTVLP